MMQAEESQKCSIYEGEALVLEDQLVSIEHYAPRQDDDRPLWAGIYMQAVSLEPQEVGAIYRLVAPDGREGRMRITRELPSVDYQWRWYRFDGMGELRWPLRRPNSST